MSVCHSSTHGIGHARRGDIAPSSPTFGAVRLPCNLAELGRAPTPRPYYFAFALPSFIENETPDREATSPLQQASRFLQLFLESVRVCLRGGARP